MFMAIFMLFFERVNEQMVLRLLQTPSKEEVTEGVEVVELRLQRSSHNPPKQQVELQMKAGFGSHNVCNSAPLWLKLAGNVAPNTKTVGILRF